MKIKKILSLIISAIIAISSISLTAILSSAEASNVNYKSIWYDSYSSSLSLNSINESGSLKGIYYYIENYETYKQYEVKGLINGYDKSFFNENMLVVNWLLTPTGKTGDYENLSVTKQNGSLTFNYKYYMSFIVSPWIMYDINFIEFKKSDVADVDFSKITVNVTYNYSKAQQIVPPGEEPFDPSNIPDENRTIDMKLIKIDLPKDDKTKTTTTPTTQKPTKPTVKKPAKVTKVKLKSPKKKQLKVTWKKIKGAKYQVQYSLKKSMKKANLKNTKKNKIVLKKLKSNKKYYIRVRAYKTVNGKTYPGKWSKKAVKVVK